MKTITVLVGIFLLGFIFVNANCNDTNCETEYGDGWICNVTLQECTPECETDEDCIKNQFCKDHQCTQKSIIQQKLSRAAEFTQETGTNWLYWVIGALVVLGIISFAVYQNNFKPPF